MIALRTRTLLTWLALALCALAPLAGAQQAGGPAVRARFDSGVVKLGATVQLLVELEGARSGAIPELPRVPGLSFGQVGPPGSFEQFIIVNGRQRSERTLVWRIAVQPTQAGELVVPPFTVQADGQALVTRELRLRVVADLAGEELGLLEIDAPKRVFQGQPFWIELRVGFDAGLKDRLTHLNLSLPWLGELAGLLELDAPPLRVGTSAGRIALNGRGELELEVLPTRRVGDATFLVLRAKKRFVATRAGKLEFATSHLEFGRREDAFSSMLSRGGGGGEFMYYKRFPAFDIAVDPVPETGRPLDWSGAVGAITAEATADRRDVQAGESIKLSVEWRGDANLEFFEPPDLARVDAFAGFRVFGRQETRAWDARVVTYDLAPLSEAVTEIPPVPLSVFDTARGAWDVVKTRPIAIRVRPLASATGLEDPDAARGTGVDIRDVQTGPESAGASAPRGAWVLAAWAAVPLAWLLLRRAVRKAGDPDAPRSRARRKARKLLARELAATRDADAVARALERFLAARTGEAPAAWQGRDVRVWARNNVGRMSDADARELSALLARLDAAAWGKSAAGGAPEQREVLALADKLVAGGLA